VLLTEVRRNFPDGGQAGHEDAVAADSGALLLAEVDQPAQPVEPDNLLCQGRIIAQSEIGKKVSFGVRSKYCVNLFTVVIDSVT